MTKSVTINLQVLSLISGFILPFLVAFVTKAKASSQLKAIVNLALSAIAGGITSAIATGGSVELKPWLYGMGIAFVSSGASYAHLWTPTGTIGSLKAATKNFGIGGDATVSTPPPPPMP